MTEKQCMKPQNLTSHKTLASFATQVDPKTPKVRNEIVWRSFKPVCASSHVDASLHVNESSQVYSILQVYAKLFTSVAYWQVYTNRAF